MRKWAFFALVAGLAALAVAGCQQFNTLTKKDAGTPTAAPPSPSTAATKAPVPSTAAKKPGHVPSKMEYYQMLRSGYKPPAHTVSGEGPGGAVASGASGRTWNITEEEGYLLKYKYGEGRKYYASGHGKKPQAPDYIHHEEGEGGTYPPREWKDGKPPTK